MMAAFGFTFTHQAVTDGIDCGIAPTIKE